MEQSRPGNAISGLIAVIDVTLMFGMGILGDKISERLNIQVGALLTMTVAGLLISAIISYVSSKGSHIETSAEKQYGFSLKQLAPKTMMGILPFGAVAGMLMGLLIPAANEAAAPFFIMPRWISTIFGNFSAIFLTSFEFLGVVLGVVLCVMFAIAIDAHLAASFGIGYGIAFATSVVFQQPTNNILLTYAGESIFWLLIGLLLIFLSPIFKKIRATLSTPRI